MARVKKAGEVWRCDVCGKIVRVKKSGGGQLICCGGPMTPVRENDHKAGSTKLA